ncbi:MAG: hypothetical protein ACLUR5_10860 [Eubacterium ventriosum]
MKMIQYLHQWINICRKQRSSILFAWQVPSSDIENYNVYVDGVFAGSSVNSSINLTADVFANGNGDYTVSVRSVKNGKMSAATQITYTFKDGTGSKPTTVAPVTTVALNRKSHNSSANNTGTNRKSYQQQCQQHRHQQQ